MAPLTTTNAIREFYGETLGVLASMRVLLIDRKINAIHDELGRHMGDVDTLSAREWQRVRVRFPRLVAREKLLFEHRYMATVERDQKAEKWALAKERAERAASQKARPVRRACPTCGHISSAA